MKPILTIDVLINEARIFCDKFSHENHSSLVGITDGKAVGTYVEHKFQEYLSQKYIVTVGNSANGIDFPDKEILTDIKVTSSAQPQSSCPFKDARQKFFGLGYNLLIFVYEKRDSENHCELRFTNCTFVRMDKTGDFTITKRLREMLNDGANKEDIIGFLEDKNVPGDYVFYNNLAEEIINNAPEQGYLTISNALQWRLQYSRAIALKNQISGVTNYEW